jgi:hypothetical protein
MVQALFQDGYKRVFREFFTKLDMHGFVTIHKNMMLHECPANLYHFMLEILKRKDFDQIHFSRGDGFDGTQPRLRARRIGEVPQPPSQLEEIMRRQSLVVNQFSEVTGDVRHNAEFIDPWIKLCRRLIDELGIGMDWRTFRDTMRMAERFRLRVRVNKFKSAVEVYELHQRLVQYQNRDNGILNDFAHETFLPFAHPTEEYEGFRFEFLDTAKKLVDEGRSMHHCVGGYAYRCVNGSSIIFSMRKGDRSYITIELNGSTLSIVQKYTIGDNVVNNEAINEVVDKWHKDVLKLHKDDDCSYAIICENYVTEKREKEEREHAEQNRQRLLNDLGADNFGLVDDMV